ncbi:O-antigen ligase family protein [Halocynthiibacter sp. C4]|uniref:O-antigen ligase family protein n=1 Tax=Halocynthiibacter sp. C4 TaxID=2992758 RepID=UPI00237BA0A6|nr:O-antigen ligase family protein [Halocynthiibacter sp. C4]MDE0590905.1 O-antigen ligase family protein [Halocynthiibacter sp. C4]
MKNTGQLADVLLFGIALNAIVALLFLYGFNDFSICGPKQHYLGSATGTYINRNAFASLLSMGLILGVSRFAHPQFDKGFWARVCACGAIVAALLATQSRAAILLGLGIASICFAVSVGAGQRRTLRVALFVLPFVAVVAGLTAVSGRSVFAFVDLQTRAELWHQTLIMIADRPFTGFGLDTFPMAFERYHLPSLPVDVVWLHPHNTYLTLWSELGMIAGSLIPLAVGWVFLVLLHAQYPSANHSSIRVAAIGVISFASLHALVDFSMEIQANVFLFIAIIALALVECRSRSETPVEVENG